MNPQATLPHDVRDAMPLPLASATDWLTVAGAVAVVALVAAAIIWWRRRRRPVAAAAPVDPWEDLSSRLRAVRLPEPFEGAAQGEMFFQASLLLREAVELRTGVPATDMTLKELRQALASKVPLAESEREGFWRFLERADLIKFAGAATNKAEAMEALARIQSWITLLKPRFEASQGLPSDRVFSPAAKTGAEGGRP